MIRNQRGQAIVEFVCAIWVFFIIIWGLIGLAMAGTAAFFAHEIAFETARKYATTLDEESAKDLGETYISRWAYMFVDPEETHIKLWNDGQTAYAGVAVKPRLDKLLVIDMPEITRESSCTLEHVFREPDQYTR